jgi:hypothetical protein
MPQLFFRSHENIPSVPVSDCAFVFNDGVGYKSMVVCYAPFSAKVYGSKACCLFAGLNRRSVVFWHHLDFNLFNSKSQKRTQFNQMILAGARRAQLDTRTKQKQLPLSAQAVGGRGEGI